MIDFHTKLINLRKSYKKNLPEILALQRKEYPDFVFEDKLDSLRGEIPIFTFHSVEPVSFENQLRFLAQNDYQPLVADEVYECLAGSRPIPKRPVCLTFDDGWGSLWAVAYPLLKKYRFKAVCFLVPGMVSEVNLKYPNLEDIRDKRADMKDVLNRENALQPLCTWTEIREMHEDGTIDFQSHGMYHSRIFTSPTVVDFMNPLYDCYKQNFNVPLIREDGIDNVRREVDWGTPIYANDSRLGGKRRYFDDVELRRACTELVGESGNFQYFKKFGWRTQLTKLIYRYQRQNAAKTYFESEAEMNANILSEFILSKKTIEGKLSKSVHHFCFPWWRASPVATELSKKAGYISNYVGIVKEKKTVNKLGDDPFCIGRLLSSEYIFRLPGVGRKPLIPLVHEMVRASLRSYCKKLSAK